jgi:hypothetical protein
MLLNLAVPQIDLGYMPCLTAHCPTPLALNVRFRLVFAVGVIITNLNHNLLFRMFSSFIFLDAYG